MTFMIEVKAVYMEDAHQSSESLMETAHKYLKDVDYDTMVGTGLSGSIVIPRLAEALGKNWLIIRKKDDGTHSHRDGEGVLGHRWIFVDDLICSGATQKRVKEKVEEIIKNHNEHVDFMNRPTFSIPDGDDKPHHACEYVGDYLYAGHWTGKGFFPVEHVDPPKPSFGDLLDTAQADL